MAARDINILSVQVHALPHAAVDEFLVESAGDAERIHAAVAAGGGADIRVEPGDPHDLVDVPTLLLTMAGQDLAARRVDLPHALGVLLGDCELRWDATGEPAEGPDGTALRLADPAGGLLTITRPAAAFTPAEYARARALLALDEAIAELVRAGATTVLANGLTVRDADLADLAGIEAMHGRCGERTRSRRYLAGTTCPSPAILARMINRRTGRTLVAVHPDGDIVAMANLVLDGDTAEAAVLVEDAWQRQGIGTALLRRLTAGGGTAYAVTEPDNIPMLRALRHAGAELDRVEDGLAHLSFGRGRAPERAGPALPFPQAASRW
jgi:RimJ/RimL family protein N-acetyltransferase